MVPVVVLLLGTALLSQPALAQERVIGLLALPEVFGRGACDRFTRRPLELRATPQGPVVGTVLVVKPWTHHSNGGCEGLEVGVRVPRASTVQPLPTMEYAYEEPGAVVLERRGRWLHRRARRAAQRRSLVWRRTNQCEVVEHLARKKGSWSPS